MLFDKSGKGKKIRELKGELKELKKTLLSAGCDKAQTGLWLKEFQEILLAGDLLQDEYESARIHLRQAREAILKLLDCMAESPAAEVKVSLEALVADLAQIYHDCSIREDDLDFQSTIESLREMVAAYAENAARTQTVGGGAFASIMLRSELENVSAVLDDAAGWRAPDFFALAYYLRHEERGSLKEMENEQRNTYVAEYCGEHFLTPFLAMCRRAGADGEVQAMARRYIYGA